MVISRHLNPLCWKDWLEFPVGRAAPRRSESQRQDYPERWFEEDPRAGLDHGHDQICIPQAELVGWLQNFGQNAGIFQSNQVDNSEWERESKSSNLTLS